MAGIILFVDDEADLRFMASSYFEMFGYKVLAAENAEEALRQAQAATLNAIILDVNLAGEGSTNLVADLKKSHPQTPILLYTGRLEDDDAVQSLLSQGADKYLLKDGSLEKLLQAVKDSGAG
jgi:two-component system response regulator FlrC